MRMRSSFAGYRYDRRLVVAYHRLSYAWDSHLERMSNDAILRSHDDRHIFIAILAVAAAGADAATLPLVHPPPCVAVPGEPGPHRWQTPHARLPAAHHHRTQDGRALRRSAGISHQR